MYAYEKLIEENGLSKGDLPKDAQIGIKSIQQIENAIRMTEKRGQQVSQLVKEKLQANDKWVTAEILAYLDDKETDDDLPNPADEVITEIKETKEEVVLSPEQKLGYAIETELTALSDQAKEYNNLFPAPVVKKYAPKTFAAIFDNYEQDGENGVATSRYALTETENEFFTLIKR